MEFSEFGREILSYQFNWDVEGVYLIRILMACLCGALIGIERQIRTKAAGVKTHIIICVASCLMMLISKYGFLDVIVLASAQVDVSRVASSIITGMSILCGGIIFTSKQGNISGITTAAGIWVTIGIGMAFGAGMYLLGVVSMVVILVIQCVMHTPFNFLKQPDKGMVTMKVAENKDAYERILALLAELGIVTTKAKWEKEGDTDLILKLQIQIPARADKREIMERLVEVPEVEEFELY